MGKLRSIFLMCFGACLSNPKNHSKMKSQKQKLWIVLSVCLFPFLTLQAELRLPDIISDHMVLQQQSDAALWGWAEPGSTITVTVSWDRTKYRTETAADGHWLVRVATPAASKEPRQITIREGRNKPTVLKDVLIGEVWFCSGQSNMFMPLSGYLNQPVEGGADMILRCGKYEHVRVAYVGRHAALEPQEQVDGRWLKSLPANARLFSAVAYFFALTVNEVLDVPVGVITCSWGGSHIAGWMPRELLDSLGYRDVVARASNESLRNGRPMVMYNGMLYPLHHYTVKGFLWYQGCSDVGAYQDYARYQTAMVAHWRNLWGLGELPFYFVEIAPYLYRPDNLHGYLLREAQQRSLDMIPNSGMVSTADLVKPYEQRIIHPSRKKEVGDRLAMLALDRTYRVRGIQSGSPRFQKMEPLPDGGVALSFTDCNDGFSTTGVITGFEAAGADRVFHPAKARILAQERKIAIHCPEAGEIVAVRYLFDNFFIANLYNMRQLPVLPFRTDDWEE